MKKAIVLLSGGVDSSTSLYIAKKQGFKVHALIFDYGQRHKKEISCAKRIAKKAKITYEVIKLSFPTIGSALLDKKTKVPTNRSLKKIKSKIPATYVPARNLIFLSVASSFAESINAKAIFIGAHTEDYSGYPDCREDFFSSFKKTINKGLKSGKKIKIYTPLIKKNKEEIIKLGLRLKVPFKSTWSCYNDSKNPCGKCDSCFFRKEAFRKLNIKDPYYERS